MNKRKPQPGGWSFGGDAFQNLPEMAAMFGRVMSKWGTVEFQLDALMSDITIQKHIALAIREHVMTPNQRHKILSSMIRGSLSDADAAPLLALLAEFKSLAKQRNDYVHAQWGNHEKHPDQVIYRTDHALLRASNITPQDMADGTFQRIHQSLSEGVYLCSLMDLQIFNDRIEKLITDMMMAGLPHKMRSMALGEMSKQIPLNTFR